MIKLVAFDWNGTIFADTYAIFESNKESFKLLGIKPISFQTFQKYYDVPVKKFFLALGASEDDLNKKASQIANAFHSQYEIRVARVRSRAYAKNLLDYLSKNQINCIIFSNHIIEPIKKQLKRLKLDGYFSEIIANSHLESALKGRNKKEKLKNYIDKNNLLADEVLIIGDTIEEVEIGRELGVKTVAINHGNCSTVRLKLAKPDYLINSLKEVKTIIHSL